MINIEAACNDTRTQLWVGFKKIMVNPSEICFAYSIEKLPEHLSYSNKYDYRSFTILKMSNGTTLICCGDIDAFT